MTDVELFTGHILKEGDTDPDLTMKLIEDGVAKNLSDYTPTIRIRDTKTGDIIVSSDASIINEQAGTISYSWSADETSSAGIYEGEVTIDDGSSVITFPNYGMFQIIINNIIE